MTSNQAPSDVKLHDDVFQALNAQVSSISHEKSTLLSEFISLQDSFLQEQCTAAVLNLFLTHACVPQIIHLLSTTSRILLFCFLFIQSSLQLRLTFFVIFISSLRSPRVILTSSFSLLTSFLKVGIIFLLFYTPILHGFHSSTSPGAHMKSQPNANLYFGCQSQRKARLRDELSGFSQVALI